MKDLILLYEKYVEKLDEEIDERDLLAKLKESSLLSDRGKELYEKALLAQLLYYEKETQKEMPQLLSKFMERQIAIRETEEDVWCYLNSLLRNKGLTWSKVLNNLGKSTHLAPQMSTGSLNIERLPVALLVDIATILDANRDKLIALVERSLSNPQHPLTANAHFRKAPHTQEYLACIKIESTTSSPSNNKNKYLDELRSLLSNR